MKKFHFWRSLFILAACILSVSPLNAELYLRIAVINSLMGDVKVFVSKEGNWITPEKGHTLRPKDQINVFQGSEATVTFQDGTSIVIKENSLLSIEKLFIEKPSEEKETIFKLWLGKIKAIVTQADPTKEKFEFLTPSATCAIRGTDLSLAVNKTNDTLLKVYEGEVAAREISGLGGDFIVKAGQQMKISKGVEPFGIEPLVEDTPPAQEPPAETPTIEGTPDITPPAPDIMPPVKGGLPTEETPPSAPTTQAAGPSGFNLGPVGITMNGTLGAVVLTDPVTGLQKLYFQIGLLPEITLWKLGVGIDLYLYFDEENKLRKEDWNDSNDYLNKILYVKYGQKGEPVFAYLGGIRSTTLGHGLIMSNYTNMLRYPDVRTIGGILDVDFGVGGFETIVANLNQAEVFGGRVYYRPFRNSSLPIIHRLAVGGSVVTDTDPDSDDDTKDDSVTVWGADIELPIFENKFFSILAHADYAQMELADKYELTGSSDNGKGITEGIMGNIFFLNYRFEYRRLEANFIPSYFDSYYDIDRWNSVTSTTKASSIPNTNKPIAEGPYGELSFSLLNKIGFRAFYETYSQDPRSVYPRVYGSVSVDPSLLLNKYDVSVEFERRDVEKWSDLQNFKDPNTILTANIGYAIAPNVYLVYVHKQTFDRTGAPVKTTSIITKITF